MRNYIVLNDRGANFHFSAIDEDSAIEMYWGVIFSAVGHAEKLCLCFNDVEKSLDRSKYAQIVKIVEVV